MECMADDGDESTDAFTAAGTADSTPGEASKEVEAVPAGVTEEAGETKKAGETKEGEDEGTKKVYQCPVCQKQFDKYQALGGHMNAHPEAKMKRKFDDYMKMKQKYGWALNLQQPSWSQALGSIPELVPGPVNASPNPQRSSLSQAPPNRFNFVAGLAYNTSRWPQAPPNSYNLAPGLANNMPSPQQPSGSQAPRSISYLAPGWPQAPRSDFYLASDWPQAPPIGLSSVPDPGNRMPLPPPTVVPSAGEANNVAAPAVQFSNPEFGPSTPPLSSEPSPGSDNSSSRCPSVCCNPISEEAWHDLLWGQPNSGVPRDVDYISGDPDAETLWAYSPLR